MSARESAMQLVPSRFQDPPEDPGADQRLRHDALERWVGVSAMAVLMAAGMVAVLL